MQRKEGNNFFPLTICIFTNELAATYGTSFGCPNDKLSGADYRVRWSALL